jgi:cytochrome b6-f complex iron-sulfur subunit
LAAFEVSMADRKKMSVAEILAAARAGGGKSAGEQPAGEPAAGGPPAAPVESAADETAASPVAEGSPAPAGKPAAAAPASGSKLSAGTAGSGAAGSAAGGRPSVAEILALARAKKEAEAAAGASESKPAAAKPAAAAKTPAAKPAAPVAAKAGPKTGVQRDTASILAAARAGTKPGPVSKAEAPPRPAAKPAAAIEKPAAAKAALPPKVVPPKPVRPAKPAKADDEDRRGFLEIALGSFMAMGFTALSVTGGLFTLGLARYLFPNVLAEPPSRFKVGFKEGFPSGKVETKFVAQYGVWVVNGEFEGQQQIYALKTVCTHLGCTPNWLEAEQKFKCPCHGSGFYKDGINFEGPAPRPLERYAIRVADDGQLEVDKSRFFQEEIGQWADPDSYVPV